MTDQIAMTDDERRLVFTEQGLADAIRAAINATEGGDQAETAERASELASNIFLAAMIEKRGLAE